jgi:hypothetical protein
VGFLFFLLIACFAAFEIYQLRPPQPVPATASPGEFSAERAFVHLGQIAPGPHPIGSPQQAQSRQYIVQELTKLGLKPEIQETISSNQRLLRSLFAGDIYLSVGSVQNVVARVPGAISNKAVLLMAHYDSVPGGPGASDNGVAVAALLEAARALRAGPPPKNDIIFLFTDGEEVGTLGANAFMKEHPWAREVGLVLNFEARGNTGSSLMFETSSNNGWLIREFVQAAPDPVASSLFYEVYKTLPNDSDLSIFKEAGVAGMNFAFIEGFTHYHTAIDSVEYVDPRSLQHHGNYALSLARHFGNLDLPNSHAGDYVYFNFFGKRLFSYPYGWIMPSVVLVALLFVGTMALGMRRGAVTAPGMLLGALVFLLPVIGSALLITLLWWGVTLVHPDYTTIRQGALYNDHWYITSFVFCAVAVTATCYLAFQKKIRTPDLALGALTWWVVLMIATAIYLPGGSYLFTWPLLLSLCGLLAVFATQTAFTSPRSIAILSLAALPGVILLTPIIYLLFVSLTIGAANLLIVFVVLLLGLFVPYLSFIATRSRWLLPAGAALVSIVLLIAGSFTAGFDRDHPKQNSVIYGLIADTGKALWASTDERPDEWSSQFFADGFVKERLPDFFPLVRTEFIQAPAPVAPLAAPEVNLLDDRTSEGVRTVRMQVRSPRGASAINVYIDEQTEVLSALVDGKQVYEKHGPVTHTQQWGLRHWTLPAAGIEVTLKIPAADPLRMVVVDQSYGLPTIPSITFRPRPEYMIASPFGFEGSEFTRVSRSFTLSEARSN